MLDYVVKKIVAKEDERIVTDSSYDEMLKFTEEEIRPDFMDPEILCIKFMLCMGEDDDEPEYTDWYINPYHYKGSGAEFASNYRMDEEFIPEILLIQVPTVYIKNKYLSRVDKNNILWCENFFEKNEILLLTLGYPCATITKLTRETH